MEENSNAPEVVVPQNKMEIWYSRLNLEDCETFITTNLLTAARNVIAIGFYLKHIRDGELFLEAGYDNIWDYAADKYGFSKSTASRYMSRNDKFSKDGNSPVLDERYRDYNKSQLQEMLSLNSDQMEQVTPEMTVQQIRQLRQPQQKDIPYFELEGQMTFDTDFPDILPDAVEDLLPTQMSGAKSEPFELSIGDLTGEEPEEVEKEQDPVQPEVVATSQQENMVCVAETQQKVVETPPKSSESDEDLLSSVNSVFEPNPESIEDFYGWTRSETVRTYLKDIHDTESDIWKETGFMVMGRRCESKVCSRGADEYVMFLDDRNRFAVNVNRLQEEYEEMYPESDSIAEKQVIPDYYDKFILTKLIEDTNNNLEIMQDYWSEHQPDTLKKYKMMLKSYEMLRDSIELLRNTEG